MALQELFSRHRWISAPVNVVSAGLTPSRWWRTACAAGRRLVACTGFFDEDGVARGAILLLSPFSWLRRWILDGRPTAMRVAWAVRQFLWTGMWAVAVTGNMRPRKVPSPRREPHMDLIPAPARHADFRSSRLVAPTRIAWPERSFLQSVLVGVVHLLQDTYPIASSCQPEASGDPVARMRSVYPWAYRRVRRAPTWHPDLIEAGAGGGLLPALAVGGPFAKLLERDASREGGYHIDLRFLADYDVREGLAPLGCRVAFTAVERQLRVDGIERLGKTVRPGDVDWAWTEQVALCAMVTHLTVWRHGMQYHMAGFAPVITATHNLDPRHPLRRLLAPHVFLTSSANRHTHLTLRRNGFDVTGFSFPRSTIFRYYDDGAAAFDVSRHDVRLDLQRRGIGDDLDYPFQPQAERYYDLITDYVRSYVEHHYPDERSLAADAEARLWFDTLDGRLHGGIRGYVPELTREGLARFCALFIYAVSVEHEENTLWEYAPFLPTLVHADGSERTTGEVQGVMDFQMMISTQTNYLVQDHSHLGLDPVAKELMRSFRQRLLTLDEEIAGGPDRYWRLLPTTLKASVSA